MESFFYAIGEWLSDAGVWAYVLAPLATAAVAILPIPAELPAITNGMLFGPLVGTAITWGGAMLGAVVSFELARWLGRPAAERVLSRSALARADSIASDAGWAGLLLARLVPFIAFTALNWGAGLTRIPRGRFLWTTAVGILPGAIVFTATGWGMTRIFRTLPWAATVAAVAFLAWLWYRRRADVPASVQSKTDATT